MQHPRSVHTPPARVAVIGMGYVGCVTAACLAELGHDVVAVEKDEHKVASVLDGRAPFYEPALEDLIVRNVRAARLSATTRIEDAVEQADIFLICVGTPSERNGNLDLSQLRRVADQLAYRMSGRKTPAIVAIRSTVFPGTCRNEILPRFAGMPVDVVSNPEFLREGNAVNDFIDPSLLVIGGDNQGAVERMSALYASLPVEACRVTLETAEMIKYACNAYHALKIAFANEVGAVCQSLGISGAEVMETLCRDTKLNASAAYLRPGFAFGGSCLPKDLRALVHRGSRLDLELPLIESVIPSNREHLERGARQVLDLPAGAKIGVFGLAFKADTDDLRESPMVALIENLIGKGRDLRVFDPHVRLDRIYGANRNFVLNAVPHIQKLMVDNLGALLRWAEHLVIAQQPSAALASTIAASGLPVIDLAGQRQLSRVAAGVPEPA